MCWLKNIWSRSHEEIHAQERAVRAYSRAKIEAYWDSCPPRACITCETKKPIREFPFARDGTGTRINECRKCATRIRVILAGRTYRMRHFERERERRRGKRKGSTWSTKDKFKERARMALRYAVRVGKIVRPDRCEGCGQSGPLHGHHTDYNKRLDVNWLCSRCHGLEHRIVKIAKAAPHV